MKDFFKIRTPLAEEGGAGEQGTPSLVAKYKNATPGQGGSAPSSQQPARKGDKLNAKFEPVKEEAETLDELSKSTLGSYAKKASRDAVLTRKTAADFEHQAKRAKSPGMKAASDEISQRYKVKSWKRRDGVDKAVDRLTKEDVEKLDELSKDTVYSYAKKAEKDTDTKHKELGAQIKAKNPVAANKTAAKIGNRNAGMDRADARLNKDY